MMYTISCSDGITLKFSDKEMYNRYIAEEKQLKIKYYLEIRAKYGIWASNQDKFVNSIDDFNSWDSRYMEGLIRNF